MAMIPSLNPFLFFCIIQIFKNERGTLHLLHDCITFPWQRGFCCLIQAGVTAVLHLSSTIQQRDTRAEVTPRAHRAQGPRSRCRHSGLSPATTQGLTLFLVSSLCGTGPQKSDRRCPQPQVGNKGVRVPTNSNRVERPAGQEAPAGKGLIQAGRSFLRRGRLQKDSQPHKHFLWELTYAFPCTFQCSIPFVLCNKR